MKKDKVAQFLDDVASGKIPAGTPLPAGLMNVQSVGMLPTKPDKAAVKAGLHKVAIAMTLEDWLEMYTFTQGLASWSEESQKRFAAEVEKAQIWYDKL